MLALFVLVGLVDDEAADIVGQLAEPLVVVVPLGAGLIDENAALIRPPELHKTGLADVGLQPAGVFQVLFREP